MQVLHKMTYNNLNTTNRAGLKPVQPMQLHWARASGAPRHGVCVNCSFLPDTPSA